MSRDATAQELELARTHRPDLSWDGAKVCEAGQFHRVLIANDQAVIRMARTAEATAQMPRSIKIHQLVSEQLDYLVPTALGPMLISDGLGSVAMSFVPGAAHRPHSGDPVVLRRLLSSLAKVQLPALESELNKPFAFRGPWTAARQERTLKFLDRQLRDAAIGLLGALDDLAHVPPGLVHGDLAGENMHWIEGRLVGILDWDLASAWDPALNAAYLSLWHGIDLLDHIAQDPEQARRARIWLGLLALERLDDALSRTDQPRIDKLLRKITARILAGAAAIGAATR